MQSQTPEESVGKAERRDKKRKPKMPVHGRSLKRQSKFGGLAAATRKKK